MATKARNLSRAFLPAPIKGVDFRLPLLTLPPGYAPFILNFRVDNGRLTKRYGHSKSMAPVTPSTNMPTIITYNSGSSTKIIYIGSSKTEDDAATTPTNTPSAIIPPQHDWTYFNNTLLVAGDAIVYQLNPSTLAWTSGLTFTASSTAAHRKPITSYRERVYVGDKFNLYYGSVGGISGAMTAFPVSNLLNGNGIIALGTITLNSSIVPQDFLVIISDLGEILIYSGSYPGALDWYLVNKFKVPIPLDVNSPLSVELINIPNDVLINARYGHQVYSLRELMLNNGTAVLYEPTETVRPIWDDLTPRIESGVTGYGYKTMAYVPAKNSIVIYAVITGTVQSLLDAWGGAFQITANSNAGGWTDWHLLINIDLNTNATTLHSFPAGNLDMTAATVTQIRSLSSNAYIATSAPNTSTRAILKLFDATSTSHQFEDYSGYNNNDSYLSYRANALMTQSPEVGFRNKIVKTLIMYSNLGASHTFTYKVKDFSRTFGSNSISFQTANIAALDTINFYPIRGSGTFSGITFGIREASTHTVPFTFYGAELLYEEGGNF